MCAECKALYAARGAKWHLLYQFTLLPEWQQYRQQYRVIMLPDDDLQVKERLVHACSCVCQARSSLLLARTSCNPAQLLPYCNACLQGLHTCTLNTLFDAFTTFDLMLAQASVPTSGQVITCIQPIDLHSLPHQACCSPACVTAAGRSMARCIRTPVQFCTTQVRGCWNLKSSSTYASSPLPLTAIANLPCIFCGGDGTHVQVTSMAAGGLNSCAHMLHNASSLCAQYATIACLQDGLL